MRLFIPVCLLGLALSLNAFGVTRIQNPEPPRTPDLRASRPVSLTGTLKQLPTATNGDYSGWVLVKPERSFDLNVTAVQSKLRALKGQRVVIRGALTTGNYSDGTPFQQVKATSIERAP